MATKKRLIDANTALLNTYNEVYWTESEAAAVRSFLVYQKTVDAVEVVRCKDCKRCDGFPGPDIAENEIGLCRINMFAVKPNGFCSYGVRKDKEERNNERRNEESDRD